MTRLAITADLHVDPYFDVRDPATGLNARELDMLRTLRWVAWTASNRGADALVVAGDYTESKAPAPAPRIARIQEALLEGPERQLHVRGNHDREQAGDSIVTVLGRRPGWTGFAQPGFELVDDVAVCAIPYLDRAWYRAQTGNESKPESVAFRDLAEAYVVIARGLYVDAMNAGAGAAILVGHQQLAGGRMTDKQQAFLGDLDLVVDSRALAAVGYSAVVFGHVHRAQTVVDDTACPVLFVGSPERVDFAEEAEEKSFVVLDVERGEPVSIERIPTPARPFVTLTGDEVLGELAEDELAARACKAVVRVVDVDPADVVDVKRILEPLAFSVSGVRQRAVDPPAAAGGLSEALSAEELLEADLADHTDREALLVLGREILEEVA